jgi:hypothetical protein
MRPPALVLVVLLAACDERTDDPPGAIGPVLVEVLSDDCIPARLGGDGGLQFLGTREDGGLSFTVSQQVQFGPLRDGGSLLSVQRQTLPAPNGGVLQVEEAPGCEGTLALWRQVDGGLELAQRWPSVETCPLGPGWLPERACSTVRRFSFGPGSPCPSSCVEISPSPEVRCACGGR